jgi:Cof subfamily protein (haloacid dehalogenase superfamily)
MAADPGCEEVDSAERNQRGHADVVPIMTGTENTNTDMTIPIKLVVVDLDGTLLNSQHEMSARNEKALKDAIAKGVQVVLATGKTYVSAKALIERLGLTTPGIYNQGLTIYEADGSISLQKTLDPAIARQVLTFAEDRGFSMVAYSGSKLLVRALNSEIEQLTTKYHEPMPEEIGPLQNILDDMPINKLLAIKAGEPGKITALRGQLDKQLDGKGKLIQALSDMVEILPPGNSKGIALRALLDRLIVAPENVLAIGDAENDIDMIQLAGIGVAVGNAHQKLMDVADYVVATNDNDGVAQAVERFVLDKTETKTMGAPEPITATNGDADSSTTDNEKD